MKTLLQMLDNGYLIITTLILLILGSILVYLYRRIKLLEDSILQHGKVLQSFMINQITNSTVNTNNTRHEYKENDINNKIDISDDESEDNLNEDEDEDEDENQNSSGGNSSDEESDIESDISNDELKINLDINALSGIDIDELENTLEETIVNDGLIKNIKLDDDISNKDSKVDKIKNISKMKIDELRELVVLKNILSNDDILKYKKQELLQLLRNN